MDKVTKNAGAEIIKHQTHIPDDRVYRTKLVKPRNSKNLFTL